jgi:peptidoglycan/xylan/chitin deacetylase (PgdA/CDA1 family)
MPVLVNRQSASLIVLVLSVFLSPFPAACAEDAPPLGATRIAKWKDDRTAAFLLMFDDSWPSHFQVAAPELAKRDMIGTFYVCPGKGEYEKFSQEWEEKLWKHGMVYGNHTMTHKGVKDYPSADWEIGECARIIRRITPGKADRLVSYAQPGVKADDWNLSAEALSELLKKHRLVDRPPFTDHGAVYHLKTAQDMLELADKAIANKGMEYVIIHGVERITPDWGYQDFWPLKQEVFLKVLDGLQERSKNGKLWITDHISQHQYETERNTAKVKVLTVSDQVISLELSTDADPSLYDLPLTLVTHVPQGWKRAAITQNGKSTSVAVETGTVKFDALPSDGTIELRNEKPQ